MSLLRRQVLQQLTSVLVQPHIKHKQLLLKSVGGPGTVQSVFFKRTWRCVALSKRVNYIEFAVDSIPPGGFVAIVKVLTYQRAWFRIKSPVPHSQTLTLWVGDQISMALMEQMVRLC